MTRGIVYVAFGPTHQRTLAHTVRFSRRFTDLPVCVVTNIHEAQRDPLYRELDGVEFIELNLPLEQNRAVKTQLHRYTSFDRSLYLDVDTVIQNPGIEVVFDWLGENELVLNGFLQWEACEVLKIYKKMMVLSGTELPLTVWNGAFIGFTRDTGTFFDRWHANWLLSGSGREMPALACAVKSTGATVRNLPARFFAPDTFWPDAIVQHAYVEPIHPDFYERFGLPRLKAWHPFDSPDDFTWGPLHAVG